MVQVLHGVLKYILTHDEYTKLYGTDNNVVLIEVGSFMQIIFCCK